MRAHWFGYYINKDTVYFLPYHWNTANQNIYRKRCTGWVGTAMRTSWKICFLILEVQIALTVCQLPSCWPFQWNPCLSMLLIAMSRFRISHLSLILGFHQSCDQNKNRNHAMKKVKSLRYDRWLIYKQPCQESGLCCFSFASYLQKCVTQMYRALYGHAMFVSFGGTQTWPP